MNKKKVERSGLTICGHTYDQYLDMVRVFHKHIAPGVILGGLMVDLAYRNLPEGEFFDAISETRSCLPDAIQILTPCTVGNGWLKIIDLGRFALTLFEKHSGNGIRVYVNSRKLDDWPELKAFFFKLVPKKEQDPQALMAEIYLANTSIFDTKKVQVDLASLKSRSSRDFAICLLCGEGYPSCDGEICLSCRGEAPYSYFREPGSNEG
jgi:formylmethanofuran dehydrogenase subunit E